MMSPRWFDRLHPFRCDHPSLPVPTFIAAKLFIIYLAVDRLDHGIKEPFLPFFAFLETPFISQVWPILLGLAAIAGTILALFNLAPRLGSAMVGSCVVLDVLASRTRFSNSMLFLGCFLIMISLLRREDRSRWLARGQISVLYLGAALNKLLHPDWQSGKYFAYWAGDILNLGWYRKLDASMGGFLSPGMCWFTIGTELVLATLALIPAWTSRLTVLVILFHLGMLAFTSGDVSWIFLFAMSSSMLAISRWQDSAAPREFRLIPQRLRILGAPAADTPWWQWPHLYLMLVWVFYKIQ